MEIVFIVLGMPRRKLVRGVNIIGKTRFGVKIMRPNALKFLYRPITGPGESSLPLSITVLGKEIFKL